jgi:hypothetical protein
MLDCSRPTRSLHAIEVLRTEHRRLRQLLADYFATRSESRRYDLAPLLFNSVKLHFAIEVDIFCPKLSEATGDSSIIVAATKEYGTVKTLLEELENPDPGGYGFSDHIYSLSKLISHHVTEAEKPAGLFDRAAQSSMNGDTLGPLLLRRRQELADDLALNWP